MTKHLKGLCAASARTCERAGILSDIKKYRHYEKPSEERKRRINSSKRKRIRDEKRFTWRSER